MSIHKTQIVRSWRKFKKFAALTPRGWVHFGDTRYKDYTQHKDKARRLAYLKRASRIRDKRGRLTINNPYSPNYYAARYLWNYKPKQK